MKTFQQPRRLTRTRGKQASKPAHAEANRVLLQEALGNPVHTKLKLGTPGDAHEREADAVAEQVMAMPEGTVQRKCDSCQQEDDQKKKEADQPDSEKKKQDEQVQRKEIMSLSMISADDESAISANRGGGQTLPPGERAFFESRLGADLRQVRIHTDPEAAQLSENLAARAFTIGSDVFFANGEYRPGTSSGRRLLAHELAHVLQQSGSKRTRGEAGKPRSETGSAPAPIAAPSMSAGSQATVAPMIMRSVIFSSTIDIRYRYLRSRDFTVSTTGISVTANAGYSNSSTCGSGGYDIELREKGAIFSSSHGSRHFPNGVSTTQTWSGLTAGETYYLEITVPDAPMRPNVCALQGNITVEE